MFGFVKHRGISLNHPLGGMNFPERIAEDRLDSLVDQLRKGDTTVIGEIVEGHIRLALSIASGFAARMPHQSDVFVAEALFALSRAVAEAAGKLRDNNITAYLSLRMNSACFKAMVGQQIVRIPKSTMDDMKARGEAVVLPVVERIVPFDVLARASDLSELKEMIQSCVRTAFEGQVIKLRELGYNDPQIADLLKCSRSSASMARKAVRQRFEEKEAQLR